MKPWMKYLFPFLYSALCIILPHYILDVSYSVSNVLMFVIPIIVFSIFGRKEFVENWRPYLIIFVLIFPITFGYEFLCLWLDVWNFNESIHRLNGFRILGAPIEEFCFWGGAILIIPVVYAYFRRIYNNVKE